MSYVLQPGSGSAAGVDRVIEQVLDAALRCVERDGFERMTIDDLVNESGVPRTSIYRKLGSRDDILRALLHRLMEPYLKTCNAIAVGPGDFSGRLEAVIAATILSINSYPWLKSMLAGGLSQASFSVFESAARGQSGDVMRRMLAAAQVSGEWTPPAPIDDIFHWMLRQIFTIAAEPSMDEPATRRHVQIFIMPIFGRFREAAPLAEQLEQRLSAIEQALLCLAKTGERGK
jgi:AcrR family transcriptional regulator